MKNYLQRNLLEYRLSQAQLKKIHEISKETEKAAALAKDIVEQLVDPRRKYSDFEQIANNGLIFSEVWHGSALSLSRDIMNHVQSFSNSDRFYWKNEAFQTFFGGVRCGLKDEDQQEVEDLMDATVQLKKGVLEDAPTSKWGLFSRVGQATSE